MDSVSLSPLTSESTVFPYRRFSPVGTKPLRPRKKALHPAQMHLRGTRFSPLSSVQDPPMPHHLRSRRQLSSICIIIHLQGMNQCMSGSFLYPCSSRFAYETFAAVVGGWESGVCDRTAGGMRVISRVKTCRWNTGLFPALFLSHRYTGRIRLVPADTAAGFLPLPAPGCCEEETRQQAETAAAQQLPRFFP